MFARNDSLFGYVVGLGLHYAETVPMTAHATLPCGYLTRLRVVVIHKFVAAFIELVVETVLIILYHAFGGEVGCHLGYGVLDITDPLRRDAVFVLVVICGGYLLLYYGVYAFGVELVLTALILERALHGQHPSGIFLIAFDPPAVEHAEVEHAVHHGLLSGGTGSLQRTRGGIHPHVDTLHHATGNLHIVILQEDDLTYELGHGSHLHYAFDQILPRFVVGVRLTGEYKLHGTFRVVDYGRETFEIGEQQIGALVGGEPAGETYGQCLGIETLEYLDHLCGRLETV